MKSILKQLGLNVIDDKNQTLVPVWRSWYNGYCKDVHKYTVYNGKKHVSRTRSQTRMAKKVCEDWANLLLNEKVAITVGNENLSKHLDNILRYNNFRQRANQLIELTFALGTGAFVEFKDGEYINIDYVTADKIFPISTENGDITECAFGSIKTINGKKHFYINVHRKDESGHYVVENYLFDDKRKRCELPEGVLDRYETKSQIPFYQIIKPNIASNTDIDAVMGMSVFANSTDVLKAIDIIFDSYINEFILGKKRLIVPLSMAKYQDKDGELQPVFDSNDIAFYGIPGDEESDKLKEVDMTLRADEHDKALRQKFNLLSEQCGFGLGYYDFEKSLRGGIKTATEVVSEKSDLFRNLKKHELVIGSAVENLIRVILILDGVSPDEEIQIDFDDSIIEDRKSEFSERSQLVSTGVMSKKEMRMWYLNETAEQADKALKEIAEDYVAEE